MDATPPAEAPDISDPTTGAQLGLNHQWPRPPASDTVPAPRTQAMELVNITACSPLYAIEFESSKDALGSHATSDYESLYSNEKGPADGSTMADDCEQPMLGYETFSDDHIRLTPSRRCSFKFRLALPALLVSIAAAGAASALLGWLLSRGVQLPWDPESREALVAAESSDSTVMYGLFLSSLAAHLVSFTTSIVISVFAYHLADSWLQDQRRGNTHALPTPDQYGHLLGLCCSFGPASLFAAAKYLWRGDRRPHAAKTLKAAFVVSLAALSIDYGLSLADFWLQTKATSFPRTGVIPPSLLPLLGSRINTTLCPGPAPFMSNASDRYSNCQHLEFNRTGNIVMDWGTTDLKDEGSYVINNISDISQIQLVDDFFAVLVPRTLPSGVEGLQFNTFAVAAFCTPVTDCEQAVHLPGTGDFYDIACSHFTPPFVQNYSSALSMMNQFDLSNGQLIFESGTSSQPRATVGPPGNGSAPAGYALTSTLNPAGVLLALYWESETNSAGYTFGPDVIPDGAYVMTHAPVEYIHYIANCTVEVLDVVLSYDALLNGSAQSFDIVNATLADFNTTSAMLAALDTAYSATLANSIVTQVKQIMRVEVAFNATLLFDVGLGYLLGRGILGYAAPLTERIASINGSQMIGGTVNRYPSGPLYLVLVLTYGYAILALSVGLRVLTLPSREITMEAGRGRTTPRRILEIDLVQLRLTSARACVADRFDDGTESGPILDLSRDDIVKEGGEVRRLGAGFVQTQADLQQNDDVDVAASSEVRCNRRRFKIDTVDHLHDTVQVTQPVDITEPHFEYVDPRTIVQTDGAGAPFYWGQPGLLALCISLAAAGTASALLGWLAKHIVHGPDPAFRYALVAAESSTSTNTMYGLALSSLAAHLVSISMPFVLSVFAYYLANIWLQEQTHDNISSLPTPTQYGHLVGLCCALGLTSLFDTAKYLTRTKKPPTKTLKTAFLASLASLIINYSLSLSDLWLHTMTTSFSHGEPIQMPRFGFRISPTLCPGPSHFLGLPSILRDTDGYSNCQHRQIFNVTANTGGLTLGMTMQWGTADLMDDGSDVVANFSDFWQVWSLDIGAALIPKNLPDGAEDLQFNTFAVDASCTPVTDCKQDIYLPGTSDFYNIACLNFTPPFVRNYTSALSMMNQFNASNGKLIFESGTPSQPRTTVGPPGNSSAPAGYALNSILNPGYLPQRLSDTAIPALKSFVGPPTAVRSFVCNRPVISTESLNLCSRDGLSHSDPLADTRAFLRSISSIYRNAQATCSSFSPPSRAVQRVVDLCAMK
ncbi:hypothetical protein DFH06DRAFT_1299696 [Mycena polygramma]|nr:hypothetical protein DFH06DRAFT_1299696 [Mycena polygramma]